LGWDGARFREEAGHRNGIAGPGIRAWKTVGRRRRRWRPPRGLLAVGVRESKRLCSSPLFFWYFTISPLDFAPFVFCKIW
jgi:hypothetical protein